MFFGYLIANISNCYAVVLQDNKKQMVNSQIDRPLSHLAKVILIRTFWVYLHALEQTFTFICAFSDIYSAIYLNFLSFLAMGTKLVMCWECSFIYLTRMSQVRIMFKVFFISHLFFIYFFISFPCFLFIVHYSFILFIRSIHLIPSVLLCLFVLFYLSIHFSLIFLLISSFLFLAFYSLFIIYLFYSFILFIVYSLGAFLSVCFCLSHEPEKLTDIIKLFKFHEDIPFFTESHLPETFKDRVSTPQSIPRARVLKKLGSVSDENTVEISSQSMLFSLLGRDHYENAVCF